MASANKEPLPDVAISGIKTVDTAKSTFEKNYPPQVGRKPGKTHTMKIIIEQMKRGSINEIWSI